MKNFSVFLEEINGQFIKHAGIQFKIVGWELLGPGYYKVVVKSDVGVLEVRVRDKELRAKNFLFHLLSHRSKYEVALNIVMDRVYYMYRIKQMKDNIPNDFVDISKNTKDIGLTAKEIDIMIEKMSKD